MLVQGQRVHVGTQADHARGAGRRTRMGLAVDQRHHTGFAQARVHLVHAAQAQRLLHPRRGVDLFKTQLGVGMQIAPKSGQLGVKLGNVGKRPPRGKQARRAHQCPPAVPTRRRGSTTKYNKSTAKLMTTKISEIRHKYAAITGISANVTAWMNNKPMPGH